MADPDCEKKSADFTEKMDKIVANGYLSMTIALGAQLGLFDSMATLDTPATAAEIAEKAGCKERYVREWLCGMAADCIVTVSEDGERFFLPKHHRNGVTNPDHMVAGGSKHIPLLAQAHMPLVRAFRKDGPLGTTNKDTDPYMDEFEKDSPARMAATVPVMIGQIPGLHQKLESGISVCEIGPARGHLLEWMAKTYPKSDFTGVDMHERVVEEGTARLKQAGFTNIRLIVGDAAALPAEMAGKYYMVVLLDVYHDIPFVTKATGEFYRVLKPGGVLSVCDPGGHENPRDNVGNEMMGIIYMFSLYYCLSSSMNTPGSEALGAAPGREKTTRIIEGAGFKVADVKDVVYDAQNMHIIAYKPE